MQLQNQPNAPLFTNLHHFSKHHDPLKFIIRVRQALHVTVHRWSSHCLSLSPSDINVHSVQPHCSCDKCLSSWRRLHWVWCPFLDFSCSKSAEHVPVQWFWLHRQSNGWTQQLEELAKILVTTENPSSAPPVGLVPSSPSRIHREHTR